MGTKDLTRRDFIESVGMTSLLASTAIVADARSASAAPTRTSPVSANAQRATVLGFGAEAVVRSVRVADRILGPRNGTS